MANLGWNPFQLPQATPPTFNPAQQSTGGMGGGFLNMAMNGLTSPLGITSLLGLGGDLMGWLGGMGARNQAKKNYKADRSGLMNMIGKDVFDPAAAASFVRRNEAGNVRQRAGYLSRMNPALNLPEAKGALFEAQTAAISPLIFNAALENMRQKAANELAIRNILFGESAQRYQ